MGSVLNLYKKISSLTVVDSAVSSLNETKETAADLNALQLFLGIRIDGKLITPFYSPFTVEIKKTKGQVTDRVTLKDTGAFYSGLTLEATKDTINFFSTDEKSGSLENKYGKQIFGLTNENKQTYVKGVLGQTFFSKIRKILGL